MARKKRRPGGENPQRRRQSGPPPGAIPDLPDRRALEGVMRQFMRQMQGGEHEATPLAKAQSLMYQAFGEKEDRRRVQLAQEALVICPDCADAYVLLAEHARRRKDALRLYEHGVAAGERTFGPDAFQRVVGHF